MADRLLNINEASEKLGVPVNTLRYWRHQHIGPPSANLNGRHVRYRESDLDSWIEAQFSNAVKAEA